MSEHPLNEGDIRTMYKDFGLDREEDRQRFLMLAAEEMANLAPAHPVILRLDSRTTPLEERPDA